MPIPPPPRPPNPAANRPASTLRVAGRAFLAWTKAVALQALVTAALWVIGLEILRVPWAPLWAALAVVFQFVPGIGGMLALAGPAIAVSVAPAQTDRLFNLCMVLGLYALIVILEGLLINPYILRRTTLVPWWASILGPILLGLLIPPWGVLLAPPLLAVGFALYRRRRAARASLPPPEIVARPNPPPPRV